MTYSYIVLVFGDPKQAEAWYGSGCIRIGADSLLDELTVLAQVRIEQDEDPVQAMRDWLEKRGMRLPRDGVDVAFAVEECRDFAFIRFDDTLEGGISLTIRRVEAP